MAYVFNPVNHQSMHKEFLQLYINQLFGPGGYVVEGLAREIPDPHLWIDQTHQSYEIWLSYTMTEITPRPDKVEIRPVALHPKIEEIHEQAKADASTELIEAYIRWIFPENLLSHVMPPRFSDEARKRLFVSPTHFWFFCTIVRKISLVLHGPLQRFTYPIVVSTSAPWSSLVIPASFCWVGANFNPVKDLDPTIYYIFTNFARRLFEYVRQDDHEGVSFARFYFEREVAWVVGPGTRGLSELTGPSRSLKVAWRWAEVLQTMWGSKGLVEMRQTPPGCFVMDKIYFENLEFNSLGVFFENFATIAKEWFKLVKEEICVK